MFGKCKICIEKDKRIHDLKVEVELLRTHVFPENDVYTQPIATREADAIIGGNSQKIEVPEEQTGELAKLREETLKILEERDAILGGTY